ncbi:MAG: hypothetical protein WCT18_02880 [Patescibacteria group bacterium]
MKKGALFGYLGYRFYVFLFLFAVILLFGALSRDFVNLFYFLEFSPMYAFWQLQQINVHVDDFCLFGVLALLSIAIINECVARSVFIEDACGWLIKVDSNGKVLDVGRSHFLCKGQKVHKFYFCREPGRVLSFARATFGNREEYGQVQMIVSAEFKIPKDISWQTVYERLICEYKMDSFEKYFSWILERAIRASYSKKGFYDCFHGEIDKEAFEDRWKRVFSVCLPSELKMLVEEGSEYRFAFFYWRKNL